jgi:hypothetical protein
VNEILLKYPYFSLLFVPDSEESDSEEADSEEATDAAAPGSAAPGLQGLGNPYMLRKGCGPVRFSLV